MATPVTVLSTELNSLANGAMCAAGSAITPGRPEYLPVPAAGYGDGAAWVPYVAELSATFTAASTKTTGTLSLYCRRALDGTNYETAPSYADKAAYADLLLGSFVCKGALTPFAEHIRLTPADPLIAGAFLLLVGVPHEFYLANDSGQALAATGNEVAICPAYALTDRWPQ